MYIANIAIRGMLCLLFTVGICSATFIPPCTEPGTCPGEVIDLGSSDYHVDLDNKPSATINAFGYELTLSGSLNLQHETGLGIGMGSDTEIQEGELLTISSDPDLAIYGFTLSKLFNTLIPFEYEQAEYSVNGGAFVRTSANSWQLFPTGQGILKVNLGAPLTGVTTIAWRAADNNGQARWSSDFYLKELCISPEQGVDPIPEPSTMGLLGLGLAGLGVARFRRR